MGMQKSVQIWYKSSENQPASQLSPSLCQAGTVPWQEQGFCYYLLVCLAWFCLSILLCNVFSPRQQNPGKIQNSHPSQSDKTQHWPGHGNMDFSFPSFYQSWHVFVRDQSRPTANVWQWPRLFSHQKPQVQSQRESRAGACLLPLTLLSYTKHQPIKLNVSLSFFVRATKVETHQLLSWPRLRRSYHIDVGQFFNQQISIFFCSKKKLKSWDCSQTPLWFLPAVQFVMIVQPCLVLRPGFCCHHILTNSHLAGCEVFTGPQIKL